MSSTAAPVDLRSRIDDALRLCKKMQETTFNTSVLGSTVLLRKAGGDTDQRPHQDAPQSMHGHSSPIADLLSGLKSRLETKRSVLAGQEMPEPRTSKADLRRQLWQASPPASPSSLYAEEERFWLDRRNRLRSKSSSSSSSTMTTRRAATNPEDAQRRLLEDIDEADAHLDALSVAKRKAAERFHLWLSATAERISEELEIARRTALARWGGDPSSISSPTEDPAALVTSNLRSLDIVSALEDAKSKLQLAESERASLGRQCDCLSKELASMVSAVDAARDESRQLRMQLEELKDSKALLDRQCRKVEGDRRTASEKLCQSQQEAQDLKRRIEDVRREYEVSIADLKEALSRSMSGDVGQSLSTRPAERDRQTTAPLPPPSSTSERTALVAQEYQRVIGSLRLSHQNDLKILQQRMESRMEEMKNRYEAQIQALEAKRTAEVSQLRSEMEAKVRQQESYADNATKALAQTQLRAEQALAALQSDKEYEVYRLREEHQKQLDDLRGRMEYELLKLSSEQLSGDRIMGGSFAAAVAADADALSFPVRPATTTATSSSAVVERSLPSGPTLFAGEGASYLSSSSAGVPESSDSGESSSSSLSAASDANGEAAGNLVPVGMARKSPRAPLELILKDADAAKFSFSARDFLNVAYLQRSVSEPESIPRTRSPSKQLLAAPSTKPAASLPRMPSSFSAVSSPSRRKGTALGTADAPAANVAGGRREHRSSWSPSSSRSLPVAEAVGAVRQRPMRRRSSITFSELNNELTLSSSSASASHDEI